MGGFLRGFQFSQNQHLRAWNRLGAFPRLWDRPFVKKDGKNIGAQIPLAVILSSLRVYLSWLTIAKNINGRYPYSLTIVPLSAAVAYTDLKIDKQSIYRSVVAYVRSKYITGWPKKSKPPPILKNRIEDCQRD